MPAPRGQTLEGCLRQISGLLRVVRGRPLLKAVIDLVGRNDPTPLHDAHMVRADKARLVLSEARAAMPSPQRVVALELKCTAQM